MIFIKKFLFYFLFLKAKVRYSGRVHFKGFTIIREYPGSQIELGNNVVFNSSLFSNIYGLYQPCILIAKDGGQLSIGDGSGISGSTIFCKLKICIGKNVLIGGNCKIMDSDWHSLEASKRINQKEEDIKKAPIVIGDDCFIGGNSIILKGTTLGRNCVVGAGSVVHGVFPDNSVIAGNPAKIIKTNKE